MATKTTFSETEPVSKDLEEFRALQSRLLVGAEERILADMERARELGLIDDEGKRVSKEWPPDMQQGAKRDFGG